MNALWNDLAARAGVVLDASRHELLGNYLDLLLEANRRMNLTRIADRAAAETGHVGDALTLLPFLPRASAGAALKLADIGSGGGAPGMVLAIARPDAEVTLIESTRKKAAFLERAAAELDLANVRVIAGRAEEVGRSPRRETFDVAAARAVGELVWIAEWALPLVKKGGRALAMKGPKVRDELPAARVAIRRLGGGVPIVHPVELPGTDEHLIVEIPKIGRTDGRYPRRASQAKRRPLG